jgi:serine phosphatase RsbU (regulator of sigma subunit)/anti-sigma regulatory factor (Ser/Thr protein kinase)
LKAGKKPRLLLIYRIAAMFIIAFIVAFFLVYIINKNLLIGNAINDRRDVVESALIGGVEIIWSMDPQLTIFENPEEAEAVHQVFRDICKDTRLKYMYFYSVDDDGLIRYYVCAAGDDEDDRRINEDVGFGAVQKRELYENEKIALSGEELGVQLEIVNNDYGHVCMWVTPLVNREGEVKGLLGADYDVSRILEIAHRALIIFTLIGLFAFLITFLIAVKLIKVGAVKPIKDLSQRMILFTEDKKAQPSTRKTLFSDEITDIENSFNTMALETEKYISDIENLTKERVQSQTQMEVARRIQYGVVPEKISVADPSAFIYGYSRPAKEVGGDFYDIIKLSSGKIGLIEGDVSGKGISAALFMMMIKSAIREKIRSGVNPATALNEVNDDICASNPESMFATVFAGVFDPESGVLTFANAGHNPPVTMGEQIREIEVDSGIALGLFEDSGIISEEVTLRQGEGIMIYTDGITESIDKSDRQFGIQRLKEVLGKEKPQNADEDQCPEDAENPACRVVKNLVNAVTEFSEGLEQFDDLTCITLINRTKAGGPIVLLPKQSEFDKVKEKLMSSIKDTEKAKAAILCCEELFTNIVNYSGAGKVTFEFNPVEDRFEVTITDDGVAFDSVNAEQVSKDFEFLDTGGMGIILAKENCRDMQYERVDDTNILKLTFDV